MLTDYLAGYSIIAVLVLAIALLGIAIWSIKRHRDPTLSLRSDAPFEELVDSLSGLAQGSPIPGNRVELFQNGAFFEALLEDIASARRSVHFETFLWKEGKLGARMVEAFCERARAGVKVRLLLDAAGSRRMGSEARRRLHAAGCDVAYFHPRTLKNIGVVLERDHRKIAVLDGRVAWVGGHCIVDQWLGDGEDREHYRDISLRLTGPAVHAVQGIFSENWVEVTGRLFAGRDVFPPLQPAGEALVHPASVKPEGSAPAVKIMHYAAICCARKSIRIQNPYFIPDRWIRAAFAEAVRRGVDVQIMVPSADVSDMPLVQHTAHRNFQGLLDAGVRLFEYRRTLLHQKVMTVDGIWSAVGSSNFDNRSFETNDEVTLGIQDAALARELEGIFEADLAHCVELDSKTWKRRGLFHRAKDSAYYLFKEVL